MLKKKICFFTGTRAEYGLLKPLMDRIRAGDRFAFQLIVSGTHLSQEFGLTCKAIEADGFRNYEAINIGLHSDSSLEIARAMSRCLTGCVAAYKKLRPDIVVILGDRFEAFAAATAAMISCVPIAHINGGEATFGLIDEAMRHAITKMSHLHFTSTETYRRRVIQLGESPETVYNVGALGIDNIRNMKLLSKEALERELHFSFNKRNLLVTLHPVTLERDTALSQTRTLLDVLSELRDTNIIFTKANADTGGRVINRLIDRYAARCRGRAAVFASLGQLRYLSALQYVDAVVGNSSSGIIEAPSFKIGTINIGDRQAGRIKASSVIDAAPGAESIRRAFKRLYSPRFQAKLREVKNIYGNGRAAEKIARVLEKQDLKNILAKEFFAVDITKVLS